MTKFVRPELVTLLYEALASESGIVVSTTSVDRLRISLYKARRDLNDPDLAVLSLTISPNNPAGELWIIKRK